MVSQDLLTNRLIRISDPGCRIPDFGSPDPGSPDPGSPDPGSPELKSRISDPGSRIPDLEYRIQYPGFNNSNKRGGGKIFCSHKKNIVNNFIFEQEMKFFFAKTLKIKALFTQKIFIKLSKLWVWDPGSGKNLSRTPCQKATGIRIRIRNAEHDW